MFQDWRKQSAVRVEHKDVIAYAQSCNSRQHIIINNPISRSLAFDSPRAIVRWLIWIEPISMGTSPVDTCLSHQWRRKQYQPGAYNLNSYAVCRWQLSAEKNTVPSYRLFNVVYFPSIRRERKSNWRRSARCISSKFDCILYSRSKTPRAADSHFMVLPSLVTFKSKWMDNDECHRNGASARPRSSCAMLCERCQRNFIVTLYHAMPFSAQLLRILFDIHYETR